MADRKSSSEHASIEKHVSERIEEASEKGAVSYDFGGETSLPPPPAVTEEEERRIWRKVDMRLMPILTLMYLASFLDRGMPEFSLTSSLF